MENSGTSSEKRPSINIGQHVWVLRTGGPCQKAVVTSLMSVCGVGGNEANTHVSVEWTDESGTVLGKTVSVDDVFPLTASSCNPQGISMDNSQEQLPIGTELVEDASSSSGTICHVCRQSFKNPRGLRTHIAKKHHTEANELKLATLTKQKNASPNDHPSDDLSTQDEIKDWNTFFMSILQKHRSINFSEFNGGIVNFLRFLRKANQQLPGPKHPAVRYFQQRQKKSPKILSKGETQTSNPQRANKASRERRRELYQFELAQYNYYNMRKKVVNSVMNADRPKQCPVTVEKIEEHFIKIFGEANATERETYEICSANPDVFTIKIQAVHKAIKSTSLDTSPGPDGVLIRTVKALDVANIIRTIAEIMLKTAYVPEALCEGRTVLIYKGKGPIASMSSWRPITIFSVLRRIIEKVLDAELRNQASFHKSQRGFVKGLPGCHVNARIIDAILKDTKSKRKSGVVAFLDVSAAFDNIGHRHVMQSLEARGVSSDLRNLIAAFLSNNRINIHVGGKKTNAIHVRRGVPQGSPLSPTLFNLAIDHIYREICDPVLANNYGYKLNDNEDAIVLTGFADDQAVTGENVPSVERTVDMVQRMLKEIGLYINPRKSTAMIVKDGSLVKDQLRLENGDQIESINDGETIKYLGCAFSGELVVNTDSIAKMNDNLNKLTASNLLKADQKLNVLNQYIFPTLTYPLQTAPLTKLCPSFLEGTDIIIRRSVKAMLGLPANTNTAMMYAPRRLRGLGLIRCQWEAPLQQWSIAKRLNKVQDAQFQYIFDYASESNICASRLEIDIESQHESFSIKNARQTLREKAFEDWASCKWQGVGVCHFADNPKGNKFICNKQLLSNSEWANAIKLNTNYAPLRGVPGVASKAAGDVGPLCRKCGRENETPAHVLGHCPHNMLLVTRRHHRVKHAIMDLLSEKGFTCFEEVYAVDDDGSPRYADIVAFKKDSSLAYILDPTVRYESNDREQADKVDMEKRTIYEKCIRYFKEKYRDQFGEREFEVRGLWFGARGAIPRKTILFLNTLGIDVKLLTPLVEEIITNSLAIISNHIY